MQAYRQISGILDLLDVTLEASHGILQGVSWDIYREIFFSDW